MAADKKPICDYSGSKKLIQPGDVAVVGSVTLVSSGELRSPGVINMTPDSFGPSSGSKLLLKASTTQTTTAREVMNWIDGTTMFLSIYTSAVYKVAWNVLKD